MENTFKINDLVIVYRIDGNRVIVTMHVKDEHMITVDQEFGQSRNHCVLNNEIALFIRRILERIETGVTSSDKAIFHGHLLDRFRLGKRKADIIVAELVRKINE